MSTSEMEGVVRDAITEMFPLYRGAITADTSARTVPGWDSLSHVDLVLLIEERLGRKIDVAQTFRLKNVGELVSYLEGGQ